MLPQKNFLEIMVG